MRQLFRWMAVPALAALLSLLGCAPSITAVELEVAPEDYDAAFAAAVEAMRDNRLTLDRVDQRLGVITSEPKTAGSILEPWRVDNSHFAQRFESTLHSQRRVVRIEFVDPAVTPADPDTYTYFEPASATRPLRLRVTCDIEREQRPGARPEPAAVRRSTTTTDPLLKQRGIPNRYWYAIDRDPYFEQRLMASMVNANSDLFRVIEQR